MCGLGRICTGYASRRYSIAGGRRELKAAGMDWTDIPEAEDGNRPKSRLELLASRQPRQHSRTGQIIWGVGSGCRATFFNDRRKLGNEAR